MVSVIMPCFNPEASFLNSVDSLLRQSWSALEVLIVDDASTEGAEIIAQAAAMDPRVRVITQPQNGGAYRARNAGLREARGEFVTFLDADDISHSRRIEWQMLPLIADDLLTATTSRSLRVTSHGRITFFGAQPGRVNLSSLLFRRERVVSAIGFYDETRKAADSEYRERIELVFGEDTVLNVDDHLSLVQLTTNSLSRGDFRGGGAWMADERASYTAQFRGWHRMLREDAAAAERLLPLPAAVEPRPFAAPEPLLGQPIPERLQLACLADWSEVVPRADQWAAEVEAFSEQLQQRVGMLRAVQLRESSTSRRTANTLSPTVWNLVERGGAGWVSWAQRTRIDTLLVPDPEFLVFLPDPAEIGVSVGRVVVLLHDTIPAEESTGAAAGILRPDWLERNCEQAFGVLPLWQPASAELAALLDVPAERVLPVGATLATAHEAAAAAQVRA